jgi:hypothetical protein
MGQRPPPVCSGQPRLLELLVSPSDIHRPYSPMAVVDLAARLQARSPLAPPFLGRPRLRPRLSLFGPPPATPQCFPSFVVWGLSSARPRGLLDKSRARSPMVMAQGWALLAHLGPLGGRRTKGLRTDFSLNRYSLGGGS